MLFNSLQFFGFLALVLSLYYQLGHRAQNRMLLLASYLFYAAWDWRFLGLVWLSTLVDYFVAQGLDEAEHSGTRKALLGLSLSVNLGILGFFKYANFFVANAERLLETIGLGLSFPLLQIILPVGISFYTFQTMAYTIDVFRGKLKPVKGLTDFALYVCFFPQMVCRADRAGAESAPTNQEPPHDLRESHPGRSCSHSAWIGP